MTFELYACATHAEFVHDVTNTDCRTQNVQRSRRCFRDFETTIFDKTDHELGHEWFELCVDVLYT